MHEKKEPDGGCHCHFYSLMYIHTSRLYFDALVYAFQLLKSRFLTGLTLHIQQLYLSCLSCPVLSCPPMFSISCHLLPSSTLSFLLLPSTSLVFPLLPSPVHSCNPPVLFSSVLLYPLLSTSTFSCPLLPSPALSYPLLSPLHFRLRI